MDIFWIVYTILITLLPWIECRGSIPIAVSLNLPAYVYLFIYLANISVFPLVWIVMEYFWDNFLSKFRFLKKTVKKIRRRGKKYLEKYGYLGLTFFVAIPLPFTGVYSGTILAWLFNLSKRKSFMFISLGTLIAMIIVGIISGGIKFIVWNL